MNFNKIVLNMLNSNQNKENFSFVLEHNKKKNLALTTLKSSAQYSPDVRENNEEQAKTDK